MILIYLFLLLLLLLHLSFSSLLTNKAIAGLNLDPTYNMKSFVSNLTDSIIFGFGVTGLSSWTLSYTLYSYKPGYGTSNIINDPLSTVLPSLRTDVIFVLQNDYTYILGFGDDFFNLLPNNEIWSLDLYNMIWTQIDPLECRIYKNNGSSSICPSARYGSTGVLFNTYDWVIHGGKNSNGFLSDTWIFNLNTYTWKNITCISESCPTSRVHHTFINYKSDNAILFGGTNSTGSTLNDIWDYNYTTNIWTKLITTTDASIICLEPVTQIYQDLLLIYCDTATNLLALNLTSLVFQNYGQSYPARSGADFIIFKNRMYLFGDRDNEFSIISANVNGIEKFSDSVDFFPYKSTSSFVAGINYIFESIYDNLFIYGGLDGNYNTLNSAYIIDLNSGVFKNATFSSFQPHISASAFFTFNNSIYSLGGYNKTSVINNFYRFDVNSSSLSDSLNYIYNCTELTLSGVVPVVGHTADYIKGDDDYVFVYGGEGSDLKARSDFYAISLTTLVKYNLTGYLACSYHASGVFGGKFVIYCGQDTAYKVYSFSPTFYGSIGGSWTLESPTNSVSDLSNRLGYSSYIYNVRYMLIFGGYNRNTLVSYSTFHLLDCYAWVWYHLSTASSLTGISYASLLIIDSRIFYLGGQTFVYSKLVFSDTVVVISHLSHTLLDFDSGNNLLCYLYPHTQSCRSISFAIQAFSDENGLPQSFLFKSRFLRRTATLVITNSIIIDIYQNLFLFIYWDCGGVQCIRSTASSLTINSIDILNGEASNGGIASITGGSLSMSFVFFYNSVATSNGGAIYASNANVTLAACKLFNLHARVSGGAIYAEFSTISLVNTTFLNNSAVCIQDACSSEGGAIKAVSSTLNLNTVIFTNNSVTSLNTYSSHGGGIYALSASVNCKKCDYSYNFADQGGAVYLQGLTAEYPANNAVVLYGDSIYYSNYSTYHNNSAKYGGAIFLLNSKENYFNYDSISSNMATNDGAGFYLSSTRAAVYGSIISYNTATLGSGAGIYSSLTQLTVSSSQFTANYAPLGGGACIYWFRNSFSQTTYIPTVQIDAYLNNFALYGNLVASNAHRILIDNKSLTYGAQNSSTALYPPFILSLIDFYNQTVLTDSSSVAFATPSASWSGENIESFVQGVVTFSNILFNSAPNSTISLYIRSQTVFDVGFFTSDTVNITSNPCYPGYSFESSADSYKCVACSAGTYSDKQMATICSSCPVGTYSLAQSTACLNCSAGTYGPQTGLTSCISCISGTAQAFSGKQSCYSCPTNSKSNDLRTQCECNTNFYASKPNSSQPYIQADFICHSCPAGGNCQSSNIYYDTIKPLYGYNYFLHPVDGTAQFKSCLLFEACVGGDTLCFPGYQGNLCAECQPGYSINSQFQCSACPDQISNAVILSFSLLGGGLFLIAYAFMNSEPLQNNLSSSLIQIVVNMLQFNSLAFRFSFSWPDPLNSFLSLQEESAYIGSTMFSTQCLLGISDFSFFYLTTICIAIAPIILIACTILVFYLRYRYHLIYWRPEDVGDLKRQAYERCLAAIYVLLFFIHPNIVQQVFSLINCVTVGNLPTDNNLYSDMSRQCWNYNHYFYVVVIGLPMLLIYVIGIPFSAFYILYLHSDNLSSSEAVPFQFLFVKFEPEYWYWGFFYILRQVLMISITTFIRDVQEQALCAIFLCFLIICMHIHCRPFYFDLVDYLEFAALVTCFFTFYFGNFLYVQSGNYYARMSFSVFILICNLLFFSASFIMYIHFIVGSNIKKAPQNRIRIDYSGNLSKFSGNVTSFETHPVDSDKSAENFENPANYEDLPAFLRQSSKMSIHRPDYNDRNHPLMVSQKTMSSDKLRQFLSQQHAYGAHTHDSNFPRQYSNPQFDIPEFNSPPFLKTPSKSQHMNISPFVLQDINRPQASALPKINALKRVSAPKIFTSMHPNILSDDIIGNDATGETNQNNNPPYISTTSEIKPSIEIVSAPISRVIPVDIPLSLNKRMPQFNARVASPLAEINEEKEEKKN